MARLGSGKVRPLPYQGSALAQKAGGKKCVLAFPSFSHRVYTPTRRVIKCQIKVCLFVSWRVHTPTRRVIKYRLGGGHLHLVVFTPQHAGSLNSGAGWKLVRLVVFTPQHAGSLNKSGDASRGLGVVFTPQHAGSLNRYTLTIYYFSTKCESTL